MARIVPKLNLNKTPQIVENHSLIFAKNIKVMKDGSIIRDDGISKIDIGLYAGTEDDARQLAIDKPNTFIAHYYNETHDISNVNSNLLNTVFDDDNIGEDIPEHTDDYTFTIVGIIPYNTEFYLFVYNDYTLESRIFLYDEKNQNNNKIINCNWNYSGGTIKGQVTVNLRNEKLITIAEYDAYSFNNVEKLVPLKTINIEQSSKDDLESWYTQAPEVPLTNLLFYDFYDNVIPNGTYQFFVRYEIKPDLYTKWFPASYEIQTGSPKKEDFIQGSIRYIDINLDSSYSFIFTVEHIQQELANKYKRFQIGFILTHDEETVARSWKKFDINTKVIYFDYNKDYIEEINIDDILTDPFALYSVKNITTFKNKLYISNYKEFDYNPDLQKIASAINIELLAQNVNSNYYFNNYLILDYQEITIDSVVTPIFSKNINNEYVRSFVTNIESFLWHQPVTFIGGNTAYSRYKSTECSESEVEGNYYAAIEEFKQDIANTFNIRYPDTVTVELYYNDVSIGSYECNTINDGADIDASPIIAVIKSYIQYAKCEENKIITDFYYNDKTVFDINDFKILVNSYKVYNYVDSDDIYVNISNTYYRVNTINPVKDSSDPVRRELFNMVLNEGIRLSAGNAYNAQTNTITERTVSLSNKPFNSPKLGTYSITYVKKEEFSTINNNSKTLLPLQSYNFYIHYVTKYGLCTNGYKINDTPLVYPFKEHTISHLSTIYPKFTNIQKPNDFVSAFISVSEGNNKILHLTNGEQIKENNSSATAYVAYDCIEIDTLTIPIYSKIIAYSYDDNITDINSLTPYAVNGVYVSSGEIIQDNIVTFGCSGKIVFKLADYNNGTLPDPIPDLVCVIPTNNNEDNNTLIKYTPYISLPTPNLESYNNYNSQGYKVLYHKPTNNEYYKYISNGDIYRKTVTRANDKQSLTLVLTNTNADYDNVSTVLHKIYSQYNMNYLALTSDLRINLKSSDSDTKTKHLIKSLESLTLSDCYTFPSMYKSYTRKLYSKVDDNNITKFDNTIRASIPLNPEIKQYIYEFDALTYYNVPTNKGIITNLISVLDKIIVHTQDSLFQFTGSTKLQTNDGQTQLNENDPFETGISEIYGSEHGFAGLQDNSNSMLVYDGYIFFDKDAKTAYNYHGQGLIPITAPIEKLINYDEISSIKFANDYFNDRFFMLVTFNNGVEVNLSFNYVQKTFVSLHDFTFDKSFSTKNNCYFIKGDCIYKVDREGSIYGDLNYIINAQHQSIFPTIILANSTTRKSIVDVICNDAFELIKTLDSISWIGSKVQHIYNTVNNINSDDACMAEESTRAKNFVDYIQIYSDTCRINLTDIKNKDAKDSISDFSSPIYNDGLWSWNYFRNVKTLTKDGTLLPDKTDNRSNIYGKYFVVRFVFDNDTYEENQITKMNDFKLENVIFNFIK